MPKIDEDRLIAQVGRRVTELREKRGLTQAACAEELELAVQNLQRIEHGRQNLTLRTLAALANFFGVHPRELLRAPRKQTRPRGRPKPRSGPKGRERTGVRQRR